MGADTDHTVSRRLMRLLARTYTDPRSGLAYIAAIAIATVAAGTHHERLAVFVVSAMTLGVIGFWLIPPPEVFPSDSP